MWVQYYIIVFKNS